MDNTILSKKVMLVLGLFVLLLIIGFITQKKAGLTFSMSPADAISQMSEGKTTISPEKARESILKKDNSYVFIDTRDPYDYVKGHIMGAENIPLQSLLDNNNVKKFKSYLEDSKLVVLYGNDESYVNGAVQILRQTVFSNILSLDRGYIAYAGLQENKLADSLPVYKTETARYDYKSYTKKAIEPGPVVNKDKAGKKDVQQKKVVPRPSASSGEGC